MNESTMSKAATEELQNLMFRHVLENGSIVKKNPSYYGWYDIEGTNHAAKCRVILDKNPQLIESYVNEFQGTFYDGDTSKAVLDVDSVSCICGKIKKRVIRTEGTVGELMFSLFSNMTAVRREF